MTKEQMSITYNQLFAISSQLGYCLANLVPKNGRF